jgi:NADH dehydrogenase [ubiquinone] 1 alpha subcomplex assembly factor 5
MWELIEDLRDMGESGAVLGRRPFIKRDILLSAEAIYKGQFVVWGVKSWMLLAIRRGLADAVRGLVELHGHEDGTVPATFQVIYLVSPAQFLPLHIALKNRQLSVSGSISIWTK